MPVQMIGNGLLVARVPPVIAAVLEALQLQGASTDGLLSLDDAGWQQVLRNCDRMRLTLPLGLRSSRGFPSWVTERFMGNLADTARRFVRVQATYHEAAAALAGAAVPHLVLKGFAQSPDYVKAPQFRMQGDIDFYTPQKHVRVAVEALEAIGYEPAGLPKDYRVADHPPTLVRFRGWKRGSNLFDPDMPLALEVHRCLWNPEVSLIRIPEVEDFWSRRIVRQVGDLSFSSLHSVDNLGYFALHVLRDLLMGGRVLHHALELATFLHEHVNHAAFWKEWKELHSPHLRQVEAIAFLLTGAAFSSRLSDAVREEIERLPAGQHMWVETCGGDLLTGALGRNRDGRLLQLLLADVPGGRWKIMWRALSPGVIAGPRTVANRGQTPTAPRASWRRRLWGYPVYLTSRVALNGPAVLRFLVNGLSLTLSTFALRRTARPQV